jgi:hypothetical protein
MADDAVPTTTNSDLEAALPGELESGRDIVGVPTAGNQRGSLFDIPFQMWRAWS